MTAEDLIPLPMLRVAGLEKRYAGGFAALKGVDLEIREGEIFALLGPNGAGKSTLINIICGLVTATGGRVSVDGFDIWAAYREARRRIGLVPQELLTESFESVLATVRFSRGLFGCRPDEAYLERVLRDLSLWDKRNEKVFALSGGMKRRVMIAKALSHQPRLLFLDEPTAGVDVELRRELWEMVRRLKADGVTVILTTHYLEEAEELADRIGVILGGEIILVEEKDALMRKLGRRELIVRLKRPLSAPPPALAGQEVTLADEGSTLVYAFDAGQADTGIADVVRTLQASGVDFRDLQTRESSLEDIFVSLVSARR